MIYGSKQPSEGLLDDPIGQKAFLKHYFSPKSGMWATPEVYRTNSLPLAGLFILRSVFLSKIRILKGICRPVRAFGRFFPKIVPAYFQFSLPLL